MNANFLQNLARSANLGWSRIDIPWYQIETSQGVFNFTGMDSQINTAVANGQQILGVLLDPPQWLGGGTYYTVPPTSTTEWATFVGKVALRYKGKIAAYEIWDEPDLSNQNTMGVGWDRSITQPPLYIDFVHTAAEQIRANAPGTLVVGPVYSSANTANGSAARKEEIFQQIQAASYSDGAGPTFIDIVSFHGNAGGSSDSLDMAEQLYYMNLGYLEYAPSLASKPDWVTEFGFRINQWGQDCQRQMTCEYVRYLTRSWDTADTMLAPYNLTRAFFWEEYDPNDLTSQILFGPPPSYGASETVTQYLQLLAYPALQNPVVNGDLDYPSCFGPSGQSCFGNGDSAAQPVAPAADWSVLSALGLADPRPALPSGFTTIEARATPGGRGLVAVFEDTTGGRIELSAAALTGAPATGYLSEAGASWTNGTGLMTISGMRAQQPIGQEIVGALASALDPSFSHACIVESASADASTLEALGLHVPAAPPGFSNNASSLALTRATGDCAASQTMPKTFDLTWSFANPSGVIVRAGVYNFGTSPGAQALQADARSLSWGDASGARYWVAADPGSVAPSQSQLNQLAISLDPTFKP